MAVTNGTSLEAARTRIFARVDAIKKAEKKQRRGSITTVEPQNYDTNQTSFIGAPLGSKTVINITGENGHEIQSPGCLVAPIINLFILGVLRLGEKKDEVEFDWSDSFTITVSGEIRLGQVKLSSEDLALSKFYVRCDKVTLIMKDGGYPPCWREFQKHIVGEYELVEELVYE